MLTTSWGRLSLHVVLIVITAGVCFVALKTLPAPFAWMSLAGFIYCVLACVIARSDALRSIFLTLAFIALPLAVAELVLWQLEPHDSEVIFEPSGTIYQQVEYLGYQPKPDTRIHATRLDAGKPTFDVHYEIDAHGLRTVVGTQASSDACILFFGGSFTFGEGVAGSETAPSQVAQITNGSYRVYNFGFSGYGAHQMLAALEHGFAKQVTGECATTHVVYTGITSHIGRVAGLAPWDLHGPRYQLDKANRIEYVGPFDETTLPYLMTLRQELNKSRVFKLVVPSHLTGPYSDKEIETYAAVIAQAKAEVRKQYPGASFDVMLWDPRFYPSDKQAFLDMRSALIAHDVETHLIDEQVLPGEPSNYHISPNELHPSSLAYRKYAHFVVDTLKLVTGTK